jgi:LuxR family maltose regulon positive regulatory protein
MVELRAADLEFTSEEAKVFLSQATAGALSDRAMGLLEEHTEGWIVGLRLAALALRNAADPDAYLENFRGAELRYMMDYLADDVLSQQPPVIRECLLQCSILDRVSGPLCDAVVEIGTAHPSSYELISMMEDANLFIVPLDDEGQWYRFHQLFREMLHRQLKKSYSEEGIQALHRRASAWFEAQGSIEEAIRHAVAAQEPVKAAQIVERQVREALAHGDWFNLNHWLDLLPEGLADERPLLVLARAWQMATVFRFNELPPLIARAEYLYTSPTGEYAEQAQQAHKGEILGLKSLVAMATLQGHAAVELAERALELMPQHHELPRGATYMALGLALQSVGDLEGAIEVLPSCLDASQGDPDRAMYSATATLAAVHLRAGNLDEVIRVAWQPLNLGPDARPPTAGWSHYLIGVCHYLRNNLGAAERHFAAGAELHHHTTPKIFQENQFGLALTYQAQNRDGEADRICQELEALAAEPGYRGSLREIASFRARLELLRGQVESAHLRLAAPGPWTAQGLMIFLENPHLTYAHYLAVFGSGERSQEAAAMLTEFLETAEATHNRWRVLEGRLLRSLAYWVHGRRDEALADLEWAINFAGPREIVRPFIDLGPKMADLLRQMARRGAEPEYVYRLLAAFPEPATDIGPGTEPTPAVPTTPPSSAARDATGGLVEPLTEREMEVLVLLEKRLTNQEIAQQLVIALPTVKRHTSNIYAKLDVRNRREAVARARELAILS